MTPEEIMKGIKEIKKKKRLTQGGLARLFDVDVTYIAYIEDGNVGYIPYNILTKIEDTIDYLMDL